MKTAQTPAATKHTPGPWNYSPAVAAIFGPPGNAPQICNIPAFSGEEGHANARLIAAAPELLAALKLFVAQYQGDGHDDRELRPEMAAARAAIAKATGQPDHFAPTPDNEDRDCDNEDRFEPEPLAIIGQTNGGKHING